MANSKPPIASYETLWKDYFRDPLSWHTQASCQKYRNCRPNPWIREELNRRRSRRRRNMLESAYGKGSQGKTNHHEILKEDCELIESLKGCIESKDLGRGIMLHTHILKGNLLEKSPYLAATLINMYAKLGMIEKAEQVLEDTPYRDVVTWSALISGYTKQNQGYDALNCFERMQSEGLSPDAFTFSCIFKACGTIGDFERGKLINEEIMNRGLLSTNVVLGTSLVDMYLKCGLLLDARKALEELPFRDVVSWNALISGYAEWGRHQEALACFEEMQSEGISPNTVTFLCILQCCASVGAIDEGRSIHEEIVNRGFLEKDILLGNALVDMYAKCGLLAKAKQVLEELPMRTTVSWNALITGYAQQGQSLEALKCFEWMQSEGIHPDAVTLTCILKVCGSIGLIDKGKVIHEQILNRRLLIQDIVLGTALVDMYAKCGAFTRAQEVLEDLPVRNVVPWNALISGYAEKGKCDDAFACLKSMQRDGISPNIVTFICILKACGSRGAIDKGSIIHEEIIKAGLLDKDIVIGTALVDMYAKCGLLTRAKEVLERIPNRNIVSWSSLLAGYAQHGRTNEALACFEHMVNEGLTPNDITFASILSACSHSGLIDNAQSFFGLMTKRYGIAPSLQHQTCMVMGFGCGGYFEEALSVIKAMPCSDHSSVWLTLLGACGKWGNVEIGKIVFGKAMKLDNSFGAFNALVDGMSTDFGLREGCVKDKA